MDISIETLAAGLIGYGLFVTAPYLQKRLQIFACELAGCMVLSLHWHMMGADIMFWANLIWVYMIAAGILREYTKRADILLYGAFALAAINAYMNWQGTILDCTVFASVVLAVSMRFYTDIVKIRSLALAVGVLATVNAIMLFSVPAIVFNIIFLTGHGLNLLHLHRMKPAAIIA